MDARGRTNLARFYELSNKEVQAPRATLLTALADQSVGILGAVQRCAAFHQGHPEGRAPFRTSEISASEHVFPLALEVSLLMTLLLDRVDALFADCASVEDDLLVALFACFGLIWVHPFEGGNGRTSVDLAQFLLMKRWSIKRPPLQLPENIHREIGAISATMDVRCDGTDARALLAQRDALIQRFSDTTLESLRTNEPIQELASWLSSTLPDTTAGATPSPRST